MGDFISENTRHEALLQNLTQQLSKGFTDVVNIWNNIYGPNDSNMTERFGKLDRDMQEFWESQIEILEVSKKSYMDSIENMGKEALKLEKALGLSPQVDSLPSDVPLIQMEDQLWEILETYQKMKQKKIDDYTEMIKKEAELCEVLGERKQFVDSASLQEVPSCSEMTNCEQRIRDLEIMKDQLEYDFENYKEELRMLLKDCQIVPCNKLERIVCQEEEGEFPVTKQNFEHLKSKTEIYRNMKEQMIQEANHLRQEISSLSRKMMKPPEEVDDFLMENTGYTPTVINVLKEKLKMLKEERKMKLKDLILNHRNLLDELWTLCCYSDEQRAQFKPYQVTHYNEDVLDFHELEVENLQQFYQQHKHIFELAEKHSKLWARLLDLEDQASHKDRLFNNRGGKLLQEEKERKLIQKKVPALKAELSMLLKEYKARTGKDFLYFGTPLLQTLEQMEAEREISKENQKRQRKAANAETVLLETRLGSRPVTGNKRKIMTPHQPTTPSKVLKLSSAHSTTSIASSKSTASSRYGQKATYVGAGASGACYTIVRTPIKTQGAFSTPDNGSPSYESFQEHIEKSHKQVCRSSTKIPAQRVLRPRNIIDTKTVTPRVTPYKTPKTPVRTPSKIPFRIATGSKIPSIVPPISPRSASKLTTPRSKLPLIF